MAKKIHPEEQQVDIDRTEENAIKDIVRAHLSDINHMISEENILSTKSPEEEVPVEKKTKKPRKG